VAKFPHQDDVIKNSDFMRDANPVNSLVLKGLIAGAQDIRLTGDGRLDDGIIVRVTDNCGEGLRQFHQSASRFEESQIAVD
jgi:hypothetical protein